MERSRTLTWRALLILATLSGAHRGSSEVKANEACLACHEDAVKSHPDSPHFQPPEGKAVSCESCHGDGSRHIEAGGDPKAIRSFKGNPGAKVCTTCHQSPHVEEWKASRHAQVSVDCIDCHVVHKIKDPKQSCQGCH